MGQISSPISRSLRFIIILAVIQLGCTAALIGWWGHLLLEQYERIVMLETERDPGREHELLEQADRNRNMIRWEGAWFTAVIFLGTTFLGVFYYRDLRRSRALQAFFASLTHELKTPLTSIRLQAESLGDLEIPDPYSAKLVGRLLEDTSRLENQVERTLELARVEGGGPVMMRTVRLKSLLDRIIESWPSAAPKRITVNSKVEQALVLGDQTAIQIILKNLLENSARHGGKDEVVVTLSADQRATDVLVTYQDNGRGVDPSRLNRLGRLFEKGEDSQGAGVGLYLVEMLMKRMGGRVEFASGPGFIARLYFVKGAHHAS